MQESASEAQVESEEEGSEYESYTDSDDDAPLFKPVFIAKCAAAARDAGADRSREKRVTVEDEDAIEQAELKKIEELKIKEQRPCRRCCGVASRSRRAQVGVASDCRVRDQERHRGGGRGHQGAAGDGRRRWR